MPRQRRTPEPAAAHMSIRRYLATPVDAWCFPDQRLAPVVGYTDAELAWFARPIR